MKQRTPAFRFTATIDAPLGDAAARTTAALAAEGFGVLVATDVQRIFRDQLGVEFEPYVILGVWNADLAWRALHADIDIGLLLPCNVIVRQRGDRSTVAAVDPERLWRLAGDDPELRAVAEGASSHLRRAFDALEASAPA
ncbi:MAG TPA: DUF302 domain-containing protein [Thermomicrobiales bacterium]|nr:DUF302 domain-containing protein [Thermomicrobiales bacterium]